VEPRIKNQKDTNESDAKEDDASEDATKERLKWPEEGESGVATETILHVFEDAEYRKEEEGDTDDLGATHVIVFFWIEEGIHIKATHQWREVGPSPEEGSEGEVGIVSDRTTEFEEGSEEEDTNDGDKDRSDSLLRLRGEVIEK
jgi:hypothetical protein